ncbi:MAG: hypothetical protein OXQ92_13285 [Boseongicola sp.]|nr:hypothetical protein [Boseongicola sp.]
MLELIIAGLGELAKMAADTEEFGEAAETQQDACNVDELRVLFSDVLNTRSRLQ